MDAGHLDALITTVRNAEFDKGHEVSRLQGYDGIDPQYQRDTNLAMAALYGYLASHLPEHADPLNALRVKWETYGVPGE